MPEGVNHPSEVTESPIEIQLRALRKTLGDDLVRELEDSVSPNTWRAYRSDLADFATWVAYTSADWRSPEVAAAYLHTLEDGGAACDDGGAAETWSIARPSRERMRSEGKQRETLSTKNPIVARRFGYFTWSAA